MGVSAAGQPGAGTAAPAGGGAAQLEIVKQVEQYNYYVSAGLLAKADTLYNILLQSYITNQKPMAEAPTPQNILDALQFLASAAVGIFRRVPGSDDTFQLVMTAETAKRRLSAVASTVASFSSQEDVAPATITAASLLGQPHTSSSPR